MAVAKKAASAKKAPKSAKQIHQERVGAKVIEKALNDAVNEDITEVGEWKKTSERGARKLKLPSGFVALVRNPGLMWFVENDMVPNSLMTILSAGLNDGKPPKPSEIKSLIEAGNLADMMSLARTVLVNCVLKPKIWPVSRREEIDADESLSDDEREERISTMLFADEVDENDMMFIFNWVVGGTHDVERFREEQAAYVASVPDS
jgi:hypothetical protein